MMAANATSPATAGSSVTATSPTAVASPPLTTGVNASSTPSSATAYASFSASSALTNTKSHSMVSVSSDGSNASGNQSQSAMMAAAAVAAASDTALTAEIRSFKDALSRLRRTLTETESFKATKVSSHERLAEMLKILRSMFDRYPSLKCPDLVHSVEVLMDLVKSLKDYESFEEVEWSKIVHAVDAVAMSFSARVSDCVAGELSVSGGSAIGKDKELFLGLDLTQSEQHHNYQYYHYLAPMSVDEVDNILMRHPKGVDKALNYAKVWDKYTKYVTDYVKKRASLELELSRGLSLLAQQTRPFLQAESHLPYQSLYCTALDQDQEICTKTLATCSVLQGGRFMEPLMAKRQEQTKQRKMLKERWRGELKQLQKSVGNLKKVRTVYMESKKEHGRYQEAVRIAQQGAEIGATGENKVEKRKKLEEEAMQKSREHEEMYKRAVREANERHRQLLETKADLLRQVRKLILECDQTVKKVTVDYFRLQHELTLPVPEQFQTLCERSRLYEPGASYTEFVRALIQEVPAENTVSAATGQEPFVFEPFSEEHMIAHSSSSSSSNNPRRLSQDDDCGTYRQRPDRNFGVSEVWSSAVDEPSDSDSGGSGDSGKSRETSPAASPLVRSRPMPAQSGPGFSFLEQGDSAWDGADGGGTSSGTAGMASSAAGDDASAAGQQQTTTKFSVAARSHRFRKIKTPRSCHECDSIIMYFQGMDCPDCGICAHKRCLSEVALQCGFKRLGRKVATFKVDLGQHLLESGSQVPPLVCKCAFEIDQRGLHVKGIYRMSGVKHKVEKLCQDFERGPELVVLDEVHPNVITNVLKLYLRQLPEPLITFDLYSDFIRLARGYPLKSTEPPAQPNQELEDAVVQQLTGLCRRLPKHHLRTLGFLIHHLQRVSKESEANNMTAFNLAIVFGPTLMRPRGEDSASLSSIVDNDHQTRIVLLLIDHVNEVFGPADSVLPLDYAKYTNPVFVPTSTGTKYEKGPRASKGNVKRNSATTERSASVAAPMMSGYGMGDASEVFGSHSERRSFDAGQEEFPGLPGHASEWESNEDYGSDDDNDDAEAIPSCWLPDESGKTKKSPLLAQPKIIKVSLGNFTGVEGVTPEKLSTQDSLESTQRLAKQPSADVYQATTTSRKSVPQDGKPDLDGAVTAAAPSRQSESLFAKMGKAAKKHSLDEDCLTPSLASSNKAIMDSVNTKASVVPASVTFREDDAGPGKEVLRSSTSPGSGRASLVIGIGQQQASDPGRQQSSASTATATTMQQEHRVRIQVQNPTAARHAPVTKQPSVKDAS